MPSNIQINLYLGRCIARRTRQARTLTYYQTNYFIISPTHTHFFKIHIKITQLNSKSPIYTFTTYLASLKPPFLQHHIFFIFYASSTSKIMFLIRLHSKSFFHYYTIGPIGLHIDHPHQFVWWVDPHIQDHLKKLKNKNKNIPGFKHPITPLLTSFLTTSSQSFKHSSSHYL